MSSPQNYGVCALGLEKLADLLMAYGFSASACSSMALCTLRLRRQVPLLAGGLVHTALLVTLFCWAPEPRYLVQAPLLYAIAVLWGMGSALNKTGISSESFKQLFLALGMASLLPAPFLVFPDTVRSSPCTCS